MFQEVALWAFVLRRVATISYEECFIFVRLCCAVPAIVRYECVTTSVSVRIVVFHECYYAVVLVFV